MRGSACNGRWTAKRGSPRKTPRCRRISCHDGVTLRVIQRSFGPTGRAVSIVGQGTWNIPVRGERAEEAKRALRRGIELGMVHVDTAEMYGDGASERLVGE